MEAMEAGGGETAVARERRAQILDAAWRTFARRGFHQATMHEVCREAELSPGSVYRYFRSKDDLIVALVRRDTAESVAVIETLHDNPDPLAALLELIDRALDNLRDARTCALNLEIETEAVRNPRVATLVRGADADLAAALAGVIRRLAAERGVAAPDPDGLARVLVAVMIGVSSRKATDPELDLDAHGRALRTLLERFFRAPVPPGAPAEGGSLR